MGRYILWGHPLPHHTRVVRHDASWRAEDAGYGTWAACIPDAHYICDGYNQERRWQAAPRSTLAMQARSRHAG